MAGMARRPPAPPDLDGGGDQRGLCFVAGEPLRENGVIPPFEQRGQTRAQRHAAFPRQIGGVTGTARQTSHPEGPGFFLDVD